MATATIPTTMNAPNAISDPQSNPTRTVFSKQRTITAPAVKLDQKIAINRRMQMNGIHLLRQITHNSIPITFFDPQYRGILDKMSYGNEGKTRGKERSSLPQMDTATIKDFIQLIDRVLIPSGHLFLWIDKFHLCEGYSDWLAETDLNTVDLITWHKDKIGMGYRTRRTSEYLVVLQKKPQRAKGVWNVHTIPDVWTEKIAAKDHPHRKPIQLQRALIEAVTNENDIVLDPAAGSFSVQTAAHISKRRFIGCDIQG